MSDPCNADAPADLMALYAVLWKHYGPQGWWPSSGPVETIIGAILVQHTSWRQTELAIAALREHELMEFEALAAIGEIHLAGIVRPAGSPSIKARRLRAFATWLGRAYDFHLEALLSEPQDELRAKLLSVHGIGPETADCIVLYAAHQPVFVVDAYARRVFRRHYIIGDGWSYDRVQRHCASRLPCDTRLLNEYHALLVAIGKSHCRPQARCEGCPLSTFDHDAAL